jgi:hypothetical protein
LLGWQMCLFSLLLIAVVVLLMLNFELTFEKVVSCLSLEPLRNKNFNTLTPIVGHQ